MLVQKQKQYHCVLIFIRMWKWMWQLSSAILDSQLRGKKFEIAQFSSQRDFEIKPEQNLRQRNINFSDKLQYNSEQKNVRSMQPYLRKIKNTHKIFVNANQIVFDHTYKNVYNGLYFLRAIFSEKIEKTTVIRRQ